MGDILDEYDIEEDPRYKEARKNAKLGIGIALFYVIWWSVFGLGLGTLRSPENYSYILGFPDWFFLGPILGWIITVIVTIIVVKKFFTEISLEKDLGEGDDVEIASVDDEGEV